jgi:hypothetical protein
MLSDDHCYNAAIGADGQQWISGSGEWHVQDPPWAADRRRRSLLGGHAFRWSRRPAREHLRYGGHHHRRHRSRWAQRAGSRQDPGSCGAGDQCIVSRFEIAVPQSRNGVGGAVGTNRRSGKTSARSEASNPPIGFGGAQAAGSQATRRRTQAGQAAAVSGGIIPAQNPFMFASTSRSRQSVVHKVHPLTT